MLRIVRKRAGVSQQTLAEQLGISFQQVQKYERGANRVSASKLWEIARYFGLSVTAFYEELDGIEADADTTLSGEVTSSPPPEGAEIARLLPASAPINARSSSG